MEEQELVITVARDIMVAALASKVIGPVGETAVRARELSDAFKVIVSGVATAFKTAASSAAD